MKNEAVRSPLFYVGDKCRLIDEIKTHLPEDIDRLIEPFVGGGSVFMNIAANEFLLNDIDANVINIHKMLCQYVGKEEKFFSDFFNLIGKYGVSLSFKGNDVPESLRQEFPKTYFAKYNKDGYAQMKDDYNKSDRNNTLLLYALLIYGFNRMLRFNKKGDFNLPVGNVDFNRNTHKALTDYFSVIKNKKIEWYAMDFRNFLSNISYQKKDLVYLDPPYLITFSEYNKIWNEDLEKSLLSLLDEMNGENIRFAISNVTHYKGKVNELFLDWSGQYKSHPIKSNYISFNDNTKKSFNEVLVTNF